MNIAVERSFAEQQDAADLLAALRDEFFFPPRADGSAT